jgi:hypothetical protein
MADRTIDRVWTADDVAEQFEEAFRTLRKLPPVRVRGYFNTWPDYFHSFADLVAQEPQPMRIIPSPAAISRFEQTLDWVLWIEESERRLVWSRAARVPWKQISYELGCDRSTAWRRWQLALTTIAARLNAMAA